MTAATRTVDEWTEILGRYGSHPYNAALRVLGDLVAYRSHTRHEDDDAQQLANAMEAWLSVTIGKVPS